MRIPDPFSRSGSGTLESISRALRQITDDIGGDPRILGHARKRALIKLIQSQQDLGDALIRLGDRENETASLRRAAAIYEAAALNNKKYPMTSFKTQSGLGAALTRLGEREKSIEILSKAVAAYEHALHGRMPGQRRARIRAGLAKALQVLGQFEEGSDSLSKAVATSEAALVHLPRRDASLDWARAQVTLGNALCILGERKGDAKLLARAVSAYEAALSEKMRLQVLLEWAEASGNLGVARLHLGRLTQQEALIESGRQLVESASDVFRSTGNKRLEAHFRMRLDAILVSPK